MVCINWNIEASFYEEEWRSDYFVDRKTKEVWAVELDLLRKFDEVCRNHGLKYCVGAGTLLGTIRHGGFIPWDDDIDLYMLRDDYDKLLHYADEFEHPYFLQNSYTEKNLIRTFSRLRNSLTTGTTKIDAYRNINKGIFIDINPLDGISETVLANKYQQTVNKIQRKIFGCFNASRTRFHKDSMSRMIFYPGRCLVAYLFVHDKEKAFRMFEKNLSRYSKEGTRLWGNRSLTFNCPRTRRPKSDYEDLIYMPFEMLEVPVPRNYDSMLRQQYGDYMKIPEVKGQNMHGELIISTNYAYDDPRRLTEE